MTCQEICLRPDLPTSRSFWVYGGLIVGAAALTYFVGKKQEETTVRLLTRLQTQPRQLPSRAPIRRGLPSRSPTARVPIARPTIPTGLIQVD